MLTFTFKDQESIDRIAAILQHLSYDAQPPEIRAFSDALDEVATHGIQQCYTHVCMNEYNEELEFFDLVVVE